MNSCPIHRTPFTLKEGISKKTGKPYSFWACGTQIGPGVWCQEKPLEPQTPSQTFNRGLDTMSAQENQAIKDESIARSVALKASVDFYAGNQSATVQKVLQTANIMALWLQKKPLPQMTEHQQVPNTPNNQEISLDEIPF